MYCANVLHVLCLVYCWGLVVLCMCVLCLHVFVCVGACSHSVFCMHGMYVHLYCINWYGSKIQCAVSNRTSLHSTVTQIAHSFFPHINFSIKILMATSASLSIHPTCCPFTCSCHSCTTPSTTTFSGTTVCRTHPPPAHSPR